MIVEIISAISLSWSVVEHLNDDYFYQIETDKRKYEECSYKYVGKQEMNPNALQLFATKENGKSYIFWKHTCTDNDK